MVLPSPKYQLFVPLPHQGLHHYKAQEHTGLEAKPHLKKPQKTLAPADPHPQELEMQGQGWEV